MNFETTMGDVKMKLTDIARRINAHLKRFESDPKINVSHRGLGRFYGAGAVASGRWVYVCYIRYQGARHLTREEAADYLTWLDDGNVGRHYEAMRDGARAS